MPITNSEFRSGKIREVQKERRDYVYELLYKKPKKAYKTSEIVPIVKKSESSVRHEIKRLLKEGKIEKKKIFVGETQRVPYIPYYKIINIRTKK